MHEMLASALYAVLMAVIPILAGYAVKLINSQAALAGARQENELLARYINEIAKAVENAVLFTSQTYTDEAKLHGTFDEAKQKEALLIALNMAKKTLTEEAKDFAEMAYGDLTEYLIMQIEAEVKAQKEEVI